VIGTTGWNQHVDRFRAEAVTARLGVVASANFSVGVNVFQLVAQEAAQLMREQEQYAAWIHEAHHATKRDAPSGTALLLRDAMIPAGLNRPIDVSSPRAGTTPGTHPNGFDSSSDTIELSPTARDRGLFATGALLAARWVQGREGWFSMLDVLRDNRRS
jgi:4-hydroxy-tetrahydrodipicolinate reductase